MKNVNELTRRDLCDISLAMTLLDQISDPNTKKWKILRDKVRNIINEIDERNAQDKQAE